MRRLLAVAVLALAFGASARTAEPSAARIRAVAAGIARCQRRLPEPLRASYARVIVEETARRRLYDPARGIDEYLTLALVDEESHWHSGVISDDDEDYGLGGIRARYEAGCRHDRDPVRAPSAACELAKNQLLDPIYNLRRTVGALAEVRTQCLKLTGKQPQAKHILAAYGGMNDPETDLWCGRRRIRGRWRDVTVHPRIVAILARAKELRPSTGGRRAPTGRSRKKS